MKMELSQGRDALVLDHQNGAVTSRANQQYVISEFPRASVSKRG